MELLAIAPSALLLLADNFGGSGATEALRA
jgi:hypothetical protein